MEPEMVIVTDDVVAHFIIPRHLNRPVREPASERTTSLDPVNSQGPVSPTSKGSNVPKRFGSLH
jgi:hypothetical protein